MGKLVELAPSTRSMQRRAIRNGRAPVGRAGDRTRASASGASSSRATCRRPSSAIGLPLPHRCWLYERLSEAERERCSTEVPEFREIAVDHRVACHYLERATEAVASDIADHQSALDAAVSEPA